MEFFSCIALLFVVGEVAAGPVREYIFVNLTVNWSDAQIYCRRMFTDLATVNSKEENNMMMSLVKRASDQAAWMGLNRTKPHVNIWQWSDKEPVVFYKWMPNQPNDYGGDQNCVSASATGWNDFACSVLQPFFCYRFWYFVTEKKSWPEALRFCRSTNNDLLSLRNQSQQLLLEMMTAHLEIDRMWTGLHFLDGRWFWTNSEPLETLVSLTPCPAHGLYCGAWNVITQAWEN